MRLSSILTLQRIFSASTAVKSKLYILVIRINRPHFTLVWPTKNFYFFTNIPYQMGWKKLTWNFLEAGHGKGPGIKG
ncbi:uncharacterized protein LOC118231110 [Tachysurus ichikawai]